MDRVGLSWRPELAGGILTNLDRIDVVEVIADDYFEGASAPFAGKARSLRTLSAQLPVLLHGVSQGLASTVAADPKRLDRLARVIGIVEPESWSEHLAFVRGGGFEIGHLAAPPRNGNTIDGTCRNLDKARKIVGTSPAIENIATLIDPPGSDLNEAAWLSRIAAASHCDLLLDLHNLHANATNFGFDPVAFLDRIPCDSVRIVHLAGGRWSGILVSRDRKGAVTSSPQEQAPSNGARLIDDHLHDVPDEVYQLLTALTMRTQRPLTVILERDGAYPPINRLLMELDRAREAMRAGRMIRG